WPDTAYDWADGDIRLRRIFRVAAPSNDGPLTDHIADLPARWAVAAGHAPFPPLRGHSAKRGSHSNTVWAALDNTESGLDGRGRHVVGHYRLGQPFQSKLAEFFKRDRLLNRDGDALSNKDLAILGFGAKAGGEIAYRADRRIPGAVGKTNLAERRISLRDAGTEPEHAAAAAPGGRQCSRCLAHRDGHFDGALSRVWDRDRIVEENHDPIARELIERALKPADERPQRTMVLAQDVEHFLGLGGLGKRGVAAQIAKHDDDLAAMAFQDFLVALR